MKYTTGQLLHIPMGTQRRAVTATKSQGNTTWYRFDISCVRPAYVWYSETQLGKINAEVFKVGDRVRIKTAENLEMVKTPGLPKNGEYGHLIDIRSDEDHQVIGKELRDKMVWVNVDGNTENPWPFRATDLEPVAAEVSDSYAYAYECFVKRLCEALVLDYATESGSDLIVDRVKALRSERDALAAALAAVGGKTAKGGE